MDNPQILAYLIIASGSIALLFLLFLHFLSSEFNPAWRMVSEYAFGEKGWMLTSFFSSWSLSTLLCSLFCLQFATSIWAYIGIGLIFISGIGALMGGIFDIKHKLHGMSFIMGVPTMPIGTLLIVYNICNQNYWMNYKSTLLLSAHSIWISLLLMGVTMGIFFSGLKKSGVPFGPGQEPLSQLPKGVIAVNGYANRLLIVVYIIFNITISLVYLAN